VELVPFPRRPTSAFFRSHSSRVERFSEAIATRERPDLILIDIRLKGAKDGVQAAEEIHRQIDVPIIYLTAYFDRLTVERAKETEYDGYILKPFHRAERSGTPSERSGKNNSFASSRLLPDTPATALLTLKVQSTTLQTAIATNGLHVFSKRHRRDKHIAIL
jgi:CheY-like chemotaxis protein